MPAPQLARRGATRRARSRTAVGAGVAALALLVAGGCGGPDSAAPGPTAASGSPSTQPTTGTTAAGPRAPARPSRITLAFAGDVHFEDHLAPIARDPHGLDELDDTLAAADLAMVNLETAVTERGQVIGKEFHFRAPASALRTLANAGVDVVSMANNHGVDYGPVGLEDTLAAKADSPIPVVGIGKDAAEAFAPAVLTRHGLSIAVFGVDQVYEMTLARFSADQDSGGVASSWDTTRIRKEVARAAQKHDLVVVYLHWGFDYRECPDEISAATAKVLEAAGADVIVGGHSHRVNGAGWLGRSYVAYGLGNFVWWRSAEPDSRTGVLTLTVDAERARRRASSGAVVKARWEPMLIGRDGIPRDPGRADRARLLDLWDEARGCTGLAASPGS